MTTNLNRKGIKCETSADILTDARQNGIKGNYQSYIQYRFRLMALKQTDRDYALHIKELCEVLEI
jgi:hypothetical protein